VLFGTVLFGELPFGGLPFGELHFGKRHFGKRHFGKRHFGRSAAVAPAIGRRLESTAHESAWKQWCALTSKFFGRASLCP